MQRYRDRQQERDSVGVESHREKRVTINKEIVYLDVERQRQERDNKIRECRCRNTQRQETDNKGRDRLNVERQRDRMPHQNFECRTFHLSV